MAQLEEKDLLRFAAATSAITLTTSRKLLRNYRYYRDNSVESVSRNELLHLCRMIRKDAYGLHNLMVTEPDFFPFFVALAGQINDRLEEMHRKLLFFDSDMIEELIPLLDRQRAFWAGLTDEDFYGEKLISSLEHEIPKTLYRTELLIKRLPQSVTR